MLSKKFFLKNHNKSTVLPTNGIDMTLTIQGSSIKLEGMHNAEKNATIHQNRLAICFSTRFEKPT